MIAPLPDLLIDPIVRAALAEDLGRAGDITAAACIPAGTRMTARFAARKPGTIAGLDCVRLAIAALDPKADYRQTTQEGDAVSAGAILAEVEADARALLSAERVALNLLGRLSGVATATAAYVRAVEGTGARITCTRKTTPLLRALEKYAVRCGGGGNHRFGLDDAILIKDNHIAIAGGVRPALSRARAHAGHLVKIEIEVDRLDQLAEALALGADAVLLDNMDIPTLREAVRMVDGRAVTEASGRINPHTAPAIAETGVDLLSVGWLTHSAAVLDIGLDISN